MNNIDNLLKDCPSIIEIPVAWGEMDAFGHVNNIVYFRYFESGRLDYFQKMGYLNHLKETGFGPILASTQCRFRAPLDYPDTVSVGTHVSEINEDRFVMQYRVVSHKLGKVAAEGEGLIVSYDYNNNEKTPLTDVVRGHIETLENDRSST
jgi:acyl-CoA thioester hydrolase